MNGRPNDLYQRPRVPSVMPRTQASRPSCTTCVRFPSVRMDRPFHTRRSPPNTIPASDSPDSFRSHASTSAVPPRSTCHAGPCARLDVPPTTTNATIADLRRMPYRILLFVLLLVSPADPTLAQTYTAASDLLFYADNTEFANRFRDGETVLGISGTVFLEVAFNDRVKLRGGLFGSEIGRASCRERG